MEWMGLKVQFLFVFFLFFFVYAYGGPHPEIQVIQKRGVLRFGVHSEDVGPFVYRNANGEIDGIDIELGRTLAANLKVELKIIRESKTFSELFSAVETGQVDIAASALYPTLTRAQTVLFTNPYFKLRPVLLAHRTELAKFSGPKDAVRDLDRADFRLGTFETSAFSFIFQMFQNAHISTFENRTQLIASFLKKEQTAVYIDEMEELKWRKAIPNLDLLAKRIPDTSVSFPVAMALPSGSTYLAYWVNLMFQTLESRGQVVQFAKKHFAIRKPVGS